MAKKQKEDDEKFAQAKKLKQDQLDHLDALFDGVLEKINSSKQELNGIQTKLSVEKEILAKVKESSEHVFKLNISGVTTGFELPKKLLCSIKESHLEAIFSQRHTIHTNDDDQVYLDRDPNVFGYLVNYLRYPHKEKIVVPNEETKNNLKQEFDYFCI